MGAQVGVRDQCQFASLDGLAYSNKGRSLKTGWDFNDFIGGEVATMGIWVGGNAGAGSLITGLAGTAVRPGLLFFGTGTTNAGYGIIYSGGVNLNGILFGGGQYTYEEDVYLYNLSTAVEEFIVSVGFRDGVAGDPVDGVYFQYDRAGAGVNWRLKTSDNSARTDTDSGIPVVAGAWIRLKVVVNATGTLASYYINDVLVGINTLNIPIGAGRQVSLATLMIKTVGVTDRNIAIDWAWVHYDLTASR